MTRRPIPGPQPLDLPDRPKVVLGALPSDGPPTPMMRLGVGLTDHDTWARGPYANLTYRYVVDRARQAVTPNGDVPIDALRVLAHFRELIEVEDDYKKAVALAAGAPAPSRVDLPLLRVFTHWILHPGLTRNDGIVPLMRRVYERIQARVAVTTARGILAAIPNVGDSLQNVLSFATLRQECVDLCGRHGLPATWLESRSQWRGFIESLVYDLAGKSLTVPEEVRNPPPGKQLSKAQREYATLRAMRLDPSLDWIPVEISVRGHWQIPDELRWTFRFIPSGAQCLEIGAPIVYDEPAVAFRTP